ncbi:hypothetical protein U9M48_034695 [Paspalum notatum var. saurae]|uniref:Uncharacterized protein n=1 Tax=Paspalum notatum var. saurae TaxID=547442 RepID=A0AAQ3UD90_PASNO
MAGPSSSPGHGRGSAAVLAPTRRHRLRRCADAKAASRSDSPSPSSAAPLPGPGTLRPRPPPRRDTRHPPKLAPARAATSRNRSPLPTGQARRADGRAAASSRRTAAPTPPLCRRPLRHRAPGTVSTPAAAPHAPPRPTAYKYPALQEQAPSPSPTPPHATLRWPKAAPEGNSGATPFRRNSRSRRRLPRIRSPTSLVPTSNSSDDLFELLFG